jgi:hypothetical protein
MQAAHNQGHDVREVCRRLVRANALNNRPALDLKHQLFNELRLHVGLTGV